LCPDGDQQPTYHVMHSIIKTTFSFLQVQSELKQTIQPFLIVLLYGLTPMQSQRTLHSDPT
jgi:hypothetical protein